MAGEPKARRYAQAVFQIALEQGTFDEWESDLALLDSALGNEEFAALLSSVAARAEVKLRAVEEVLGDAGRLARNLAGLLAERGQARLAGAIREEFEKLVDEHRGIARAEVVAAVALDDVRRERVERFLGELSGKRVIVSERVDPSILGGLVARVGDLLVDGSLRARLRALGETLEEPPERLPETV